MINPKYLLICLLPLVMFLPGCSILPSEPPNVGPQEKLQIHLQTGFVNDRVRIEIDRRVIYERRATTHPFLGLADVIDLDWPLGEHSIRVVVEGLHTDKPFVLSNELYIGVKFHRQANSEMGIERGVEVELSDIPYRYD